MTSNIGSRPIKLSTSTNPLCWSTFMIQSPRYNAKGGCPPYDPVSMYKVLILQAQHHLSGAWMEFLLQNRLPWMRFAAFDPGQKTPDENRTRLLLNTLTESSVPKRVMKVFD